MIKLNLNGLNVHPNCIYKKNKQNAIKNTPAFGKSPVSALTHWEKAARIAEELATWVTTENSDSYTVIFEKIMKGLEEQIKTIEGRKGIESAYEYIIMHQKYRKQCEVLEVLETPKNEMSEILENSSEGRGFVLPTDAEKKQLRLLGIMAILKGKTVISEEVLEKWCDLLLNPNFVKDLEHLSNQMMPYSYDLVNGFVKSRATLLQVGPLTIEQQHKTSRFPNAVLTVTRDTFLN